MKLKCEKCGSTYGAGYWHSCGMPPQQVSEGDPVNHPSHYKLFPDLEAIDVIERTLTPEEFMGYCKGNALKYRLRAGEKGDAAQDLAKANWYRDRIAKAVQ